MSLDGCDAWDTCLECPLPRCKYDDPGEYRSLLRRERDRRIALHSHQGVGVIELTRMFGVSARTIRQVLEKYNDTKQHVEVHAGR